MSTPNKVVPLIRMDTAVSYLNGQEPGDAVQATALHRGFMFGYEHEGRMVTYFEDVHPDSRLVRGQKRVQGVFPIAPTQKLYRYDPDIYGWAAVLVLTESRERAVQLINAELKAARPQYQHVHPEHLQEIESDQVVLIDL